MSLDQISFLPPEQQRAILDGPALKPPPGVTPNFENPPNKNVLSHVAIAICLAASTLGVVVRIYSRAFCLKRVQIQDYIALAGFGMYVGFIYVNYWILLDFAGLFVHQWDVQVKNLAPFLYMVHVGTNLYGVAMLLIKVAIMVEWLRIFVPTGTRNLFFWACHTLLWFNILYYVAVRVAANLQCRPFAKIWDKTIPGGSCYDWNVGNLVSSAVNVISDIGILLLPQRVIWGLHMSTKRKISISVVFAIGLFGCISAIVRLAVTVLWLDADDSMYAAGAVSLWCIAEMTCALLVFCVPAFPKAFTAQEWVHRLAASMRSWTELNRTRRSNDNSRSPWSKPTGNRTPINESKDGIPLGKVSTGKRSNVESILESQTDQLPEAGIVRVTKFTAREHRVDGEDDPNMLNNQQHPWVV